MLSIAPLGMASDASATYCQSQVSEEAKIEGYYHGHGEPAGQWQGNGIAALGLEAGRRVTDKDFAAILRGFHPETGEALVQGAGDSHRAGWDLTFSAPKSVSAIWAVAQADMPELHADMSKMQQAAVAKALQHLEQEAAYTRRGKGGAEKEKLSGLITSQYEHCDTRELDPDLHTHMLVMNLAQRADGTWGSIDPQRLYQWKMAAGAIYRAELAAQLQAHGFKIEADRDSFRIAGVPQDLCDTWSKRRAQISDALEKSGHNSAKAAEIANLGTRKTKQEAKSRDELFAKWQTEAEELGFTPETINRLMQGQAAEQPQSNTANSAATAEIKSQLEAPRMLSYREWCEVQLSHREHWDDWFERAYNDPEQREMLMESEYCNYQEGMTDEIAVWEDEHQATPAHTEQAMAVDVTDQDEQAVTEDEPVSIYDKLTQNESTFTIQNLWRAVAVEQQHLGQGYSTIQTRVDELLADQEIITLCHNETGERRFTTRSMLQIERGMAHDAESMAENTAHALDGAVVDQSLLDFAKDKGFSLSVEQQAAVRHITQESGAIALVRGAAGSGKSTMAAAARLAWESAGYQVRGCALSGKAGSGLQEGSGIKSQTIHSLLMEIAKYDLTLAKKQESADKAERAYQGSLYRGHQPSQKLIDWRDRTKQELADWQSRKFTEKTVLVVDEAGMVGSRQMQRLLDTVKSAGAKIVLIGDELQLQAVDAGGAFRALQKTLSAAMLKNNKIKSVRAELNEVRRQRNADDKQAANDIAAGNAVEAITNYASRGRITVEETAEQTKQRIVADWLADETSQSNKIMLSSTRADVRDLNDMARQHMHVGHRLVNEHEITTGTGGKLAFAEGDRVLFTQNSALLGVRNGMLGYVRRIELTNDGDLLFKVQLDGVNGQYVTFNATGGKDKYNHLDHGYAVTIHKSQGDTVDKAYFYAGGSMLDKELGYVAMSRHRDVCQVYCSEKQIENQIERAAAEHDIEATGRMVAVADKIAEQCAKTIPEIAAEREEIRANGDSFLDVRAFLNSYSGKQIETEDRAADPFEGFDRITELKELARALGRSHAKDTTLDYSEVEREMPTPAPNAAPIAALDTANSAITDTTPQAEAPRMLGYREWCEVQLSHREHWDDWFERAYNDPEQREMLMESEYCNYQESMTDEIAVWEDEHQAALSSTKPAPASASLKKQDALAQALEHEPEPEN